MDLGGSVTLWLLVSCYRSTLHSRSSQFRRNHVALDLPIKLLAYRTKELTLAALAGLLEGFLPVEKLAGPCTATPFAIRCRTFGEFWYEGTES